MLLHAILPECDLRHFNQCSPSNLALRAVTSWAPESHFAKPIATEFGTMPYVDLAHTLYYRNRKMSREEYEYYYSHISAKIRLSTAFHK